MTAIAGLVDGNDVYISGDSLGVSPATLHKTVRQDPKVMVVGPFIIGGTTSFRMIELLQFKFAPPEQTIAQSDYQYMVTSFIDAVRKCFSENGFGDEHTGGAFLVGYKGKLYVIESDYQVGIPALPYAAVGCGEGLCLGSLFSTEGTGMKPEDRLTLALSAASTFSAGVSGPFNIIKLQGAKPQAAPKPKKAATKKKTK